jgi:purine-nucleoside phosphorylase
VNVPRAQVEAYYFGSPPSIGGKILFIKREQRLVEYAHHLTNVQAFGNVWRGITGSLCGERVSVIAMGIGPGRVGDALYALDRPAATYLYSGTCGGLAPGLEIGDYFVADRAVCGEGFSFHLGYAPLATIAGHPDALRALTILLGKKVERVHAGTTFTTSSVVREADADFWDVVGAECQAIEMGAAALYAAARATGKRAAAYFWVTDLPHGGKSFFEPLSPEEVRTKQDRYDRTVALDIELLARM